MEFINRLAQLTTSALPTTGPAPSGGGRIPPLRCYVSVPGAAYDLHCAYLGEPTLGVRRSRPTPYVCTGIRLRRLLTRPCEGGTQCGLVVDGIVGTGPGRVFNQEKRVGTGLKNGLGGETGAWRAVAYVGEVPQRDTTRL